MGEIKLFVDTDGQPGLEIVRAFVNVADSGITIIHDVSRISKTYLFLKDVTRFSRSEIMIGLKRKQFAYSG